MPGYTIDTQDLGPLFPDNDPLVFNLPNPDGKGGLLEFHAVDDPILPDDSQYGLDSRPRTALLDHLCSQVLDEEQAELRKAASTLMDEGLLREANISELFTFLRDQRSKASKARLKRVTMRPTGGQSPSPLSSITD